ncbi:sensor histidine kinase [Portibacter lacus]|uniref:histidine kinase n=1 Tax=Portibacter lacus TaxID=1099794 RepID=A0AA37WFU1_9BACT|nr:ATP-binding protein [Portibacter lacus]GLR19123.1 hypothetical protein GCM10007940_37390 [Portibacter lacus]
MKAITTYAILMIFMGLSTLMAQEKSVLLSKDMFQTHQILPLSTLDGWVFKKGDHRDWGEVEVNTRDWKPKKISEINTNYEDESGRIEGWFRIRIRIDSSLSNLELGLNRQLWAATDVYINGELDHSFGSTNEKYEAYNPILKYPTSINLNAGEEYLIAVHFVDYETTFTQREIRLKQENLKRFLNLTGPEYADAVTRQLKLTHIYGTLNIGISFLLFLLFWFLVLLNQNQTIFIMIATMATFVLLTAIGIFYNTFYEISYDEEKTRFLITITLQAFIATFGLLILEWVLLKKITWLSITILIVVTFTSTIAHIFSISFPFGISFSVMLVYVSYLLYTHWKSINAGQLAVIAALVMPIIANIFYVNVHKFSLDFFYHYDKLITSFSLLSAPIFLMLYIAVRFKEILKDAELEANKVLMISQEKKELLADQNVKLESLVTERTSELKNSLENLKATQDQLIQSEKMASLGELTAGIAHEIQNPLNFVNNFSEVSNELIVEMNEEIEKGDLEEAKLIAEDIKQNLSKINHHGKRADAIVKGMLQHSRKSTAEKEPTDINKLADEYLRLAYHGLRAKDQTFNATLLTEYDESIGMIDVIPQDIGRVILNLITNAFYVVKERKLSEEKVNSDYENNTGSEGLDMYIPIVSIKTQQKENKVEIIVKDNGNGIPNHILDKIFQPFFTTKPTGQGTGLGLSMSYDIVTKGHGGELKVKTEEGKGTTFIIELPIDNPKN